MDETTRAADRRRMAHGLLVILAATLIYPAYHLAIAAQADDTNHLETTLALIVERQLRDGPGTLYGPFSGQKPLVLIHAPLYYRLAASGSWALVGLGVAPTTAAFASGRLIALLGFLAGLAVVHRIATVDGAPRRAGIWSVLLV